MVSLFILPQKSLKGRKLYAVNYECNCGMNKIPSQYQKLLHQMRNLYFINCSIFIQESKAQNTVLPGLFIPYQLEYII